MRARLGSDAINPIGGRKPLKPLFTAQATQHGKACPVGSVACAHGVSLSRILPKAYS